MLAALQGRKGGKVRVRWDALTEVWTRVVWPHWTAWACERGIIPTVSLRDANLRGADLSDANLSDAYYPIGELPHAWTRDASGHLARAAS